MDLPQTGIGERLSFPGLRARKVLRTPSGDYQIPNENGVVWPVRLKRGREPAIGQSYQVRHEGGGREGSEVRGGYFASVRTCATRALISSSERPVIGFIFWVLPSLMPSLMAAMALASVSSAWY